MNPRENDQDYKVYQICCFFVEKNVPHLVFVYPGERKKEREEKKKHLEKKAFAQKTKFMSLVEFERKWNESVKLSESRDVMTRSVSSRVSLSGSGCCALPEVNLGRLTEWNRHQRVFRNFFSSSAGRSTFPSGLDENHEARGFLREEGSIKQALFRRLTSGWHACTRRTNLLVSACHSCVTWGTSFAPLCGLCVLRKTYAASCYIASTFDNLIGRDFTWKCACYILRAR